MKRGEVWTVAGGGKYAGKRRPVVIIQDGRFDLTQSITVCPFTTNPASALLFRLPIQPSHQNGLRNPCRIMVDKVINIPRRKVGGHIGRLSDEDMLRLNRALVVFLGVAGLGSQS